MTNTHIKQVNDALSVLKSQPLRKITRAADMLCLRFGQLIEKRSAVRDDNGKFIVAHTLRGEYALHIQCCFRLTFGRTIVAAKNDLYQLPRAKLAEVDDIPEEYDYDVVGNNRLDEILSSDLSDLKDFVVNEVTVGRFGDIRLGFANHFELETFMDVSGCEECRRFFQLGSDDHLMVAAQGLAVDPAEENNV